MIHKRGSILQETAVLEPHQPGHPACQLDIMRRNQGPDPFLGDDAKEFGMDLIRGPGIEIAGWFVSQ